MKRLIRKTSHKRGLSPGTLVHIGDPKTAPVNITIFDYDENTLKERQAEGIHECFAFRDTPTVTWINIDGIHQTGIVEQIGKHYNIHSLVLEDIVNTEHRPKMEDMGNYIFVVLKMLSYNEKEHDIKTEQVSLILGPNYLISFEEDIGDVFDSVRERIRKGNGRLRKSGADYLAYALIDAVVDNYYVILEKLGENIEKLEEELLANPSRKMLIDIHKLRRDMILLRKSVWPLRELISALERVESPLVKNTTDIFLRDIYDHTIEIIDTLETFRDMVSEMFDIYLSSISNRLNEIMKVLTIITTIFIPLTFVAGIYGMNFVHMPEIKWQLGYVWFWGIVIIVAMVMIIFIKRKKWF
jgi:magnesium transporter